MAQPQHPDAHRAPATVQYWVSICWGQGDEFDPALPVDAPVDCRFAVFKEAVAQMMSEADYDQVLPDQLEITVGAQHLADDEVVEQGSEIKVILHDLDYQDKVQQLINSIQGSNEEAEAARESYRKLTTIFASLKNSRTGTMDRSFMMERFVDILISSHRDAGQLRGGSKLFQYVLKVLEKEGATKESVLDELDGD